MSGDRAVVEDLLSEDFTFYSPADVGIDRARYFERCWPNAGSTTGFEFVRLVESGEEVVVTYESTRIDGSRFRNTEVLAFDGAEKLCRAEDLLWVGSGLRDHRSGSGCAARRPNWQGDQPSDA